MLRQQQSRNNCNADENNHGDSALDPGSGDWRKRPGSLSRRHRRVEHSDAGNFSRRKTSARRRCLRFRFIRPISEFVRHAMLLPFPEPRPALQIRSSRRSGSATERSHGSHEFDISAARRLRLRLSKTLTPRTVLLYNDGGEGALKNAEIAMAASELLRGAMILITPEEQQRME